MSARLGISCMVKTPTKKLSFEEYLNYDDGTKACYELVEGELILMPPASFLHSDIIDFLADLIKKIARENKLDIKVKTGDVGIRTGINSSRIPDLSVIQGDIWRSMPRNSPAVMETALILAVEVVLKDTASHISPGVEQISRDYTDKVTEYLKVGIPEYWIIDPLKNKITVLVLDRGSYRKSIFGGSDIISSNTFPQLKVTANEILQV